MLVLNWDKRSMQTKHALQNSVTSKRLIKSYEDTTERTSCHPIMSLIHTRASKRMGTLSYLETRMATTKCSTHEEFRYAPTRWGRRTCGACASRRKSSGCKPASDRSAGFASQPFVGQFSCLAACALQATSRLAGWICNDVVLMKDTKTERHFCLL